MRYKHRLFIDGTWRGGEADMGIALIDPATAQPIGEVARASRRDIEDALASAGASAAAWREVGARARGEILVRAARLLEPRITAAAQALCAEQGKTIREATGEYARVIETLIWNGEQAEALCACVRVDGHRTLMPEPIGVVAARWGPPGSIGQRCSGSGTASRRRGHMTRRRAASTVFTEVLVEADHLAGSHTH